MSLLYVRTHWCDQQPGGVAPQQPVPPWTAGYPGPVPLQRFTLNPVTGVTGPLEWPGVGPVSVRQTHHVWFPVVAHSDLDGAGWASGPTWAGSPPPEWPAAAGAPPNTSDLGYGAAAAGFRVNRLRFWLDAPPGTDFQLTVTAPDGTTLPGPLPTALGWSAYVIVPASLADGKGIWTVEINRVVGSSVAAPSLLPTTANPGNSVSESYVSPYGDLFEGILGVEVDGIEIVSPDPRTVGTTVSIGKDCDPQGRRKVSLDLTFAPPLTNGWSYNVTWTTGVSAAHPTATGVVGQVPLQTLPMPAPVDYPAGTYFPSATVVLTPPGGAAFTQVVDFSTGRGPEWWCRAARPPAAAPTCASPPTGPSSAPRPTLAQALSHSPPRC